MISIVEQSHEFLVPSLHRAAVCIDATMGHGKDSLFFLKHNVKRVYAYEIQEDVYDKTVEKVNDKRLVAYLKGHESMDEDVHEEVDAIVFNFGYCPGKDEDITTLANTSLIAVQKAMDLLKVKGRMVLVMYPHDKGLVEAKVIEGYLDDVDHNKYYIEKRTQLNQAYSPYMIAIQRLK